MVGKRLFHKVKASVRDVTFFHQRSVSCSLPDTEGFIFWDIVMLLQHSM